jgi:hypothetical protein
MQTHLFNIPFNSVNDEFLFFLASDTHLEDPAFDKAFFTAEFDEAASRGARIFLNGDIFSMIVPGDFKRFRKSQDALPKRDDFINEIVQRGAELFKPYADYIDIVGVGNHETEYMKRTGYDPVSGLITLLQQHTTHQIVHGGFEGFITLNFEREAGGGTRRYTIWYNHGQGGASAEVSQGMIDLQRRAYIDADLVWLGHKHKRIGTMLPPKIGVDRENNVYMRERRGVITGTYLKTFSQYEVAASGYMGSYGSEKVRVPQLRGGVMLSIKPKAEGAEGRLLI